MGDWTQWIAIGHGLEHIVFCCYLHRIWEFNWFSIVSVELTFKLNYEGASALMGPSSSHFELIYIVGTCYKGWIDFRFTVVENDVLVIMQGCKGVSEQGLSIGLID